MSHPDNSSINKEIISLIVAVDLAIGRCDLIKEDIAEVRSELKSRYVSKRKIIRRR